MNDSDQLLNILKTEQHVAIAAIGVPDGCTFFTEIVLGGALRAILRREGIGWSKWSGSRQPHFVVELITAPDRAPVLRAVRNALDEIGILGCCHIAYLDWDEIYWRTIHPLGAPPFDRFLNPAQAVAAQSEFGAWLEAYRELARRQNPPKDRPPT